jgi:hypothetical protein
VPGKKTILLFDSFPPQDCLLIFSLDFLLVPRACKGASKDSLAPAIGLTDAPGPLTGAYRFVFLTLQLAFMIL